MTIRWTDFEDTVREVKAIQGLLQLAGMALEEGGPSQGDGWALTWLALRLSDTHERLHTIFNQLHEEMVAAKADKPDATRVPRDCGE